MADSSEWNPLGDLPTPLATMLLVAVPSATMLLGSIIVRHVTVSVTHTARMCLCMRTHWQMQP